MNNSTTPTRKKILLNVDQKLVSIMDIILKQKQISRTKFLNMIISERIQTHKEQIKSELRAYETSLDARLDPNQTNDGE